MLKRRHVYAPKKIIYLFVFIYLFANLVAEEPRNALIIFDGRRRISWLNIVLYFTPVLFSDQCPSPSVQMVHSVFLRDKNEDNRTNISSTIAAYSGGMWGARRYRVAHN